MAAQAGGCVVRADRVARDAEAQRHQSGQERIRQALDLGVDHLTLTVDAFRNG